MKLQPTYRFRTGQWYILTKKQEGKKVYTHLIYASGRREGTSLYDIKIILLSETQPYNYRIYDSVLSSPKDMIYHTTYRLINKKIIPTLNEVLLQYDKCDGIWNENIAQNWNENIVQQITDEEIYNAVIRYKNYRQMKCVPYYCLIYDFINSLSNEQTQ